MFFRHRLFVRRKPELRILCYHRILRSPAEEFTIESALGVPLREFERHLAFLHKKYTIVPLAAFPELSKRAHKRPFLAITFDDGYADNLDFALPVLERYEAPATIFLTTGAVLSGKPFWWNELSEYVARAPQRQYAFALDGESFEYDLRKSLSKKKLFWRLFTLLRRVEDDKKDEYLRRVKEIFVHSREAVEKNEQSLSDFLTAERIERENSEFITFGAHTVNHVILTRVPLERAAREIRESIQRTAQWSGRTVTTFAYPNGQRNDFNEEIEEVLRQEGIECAVTTLKGTNGFDHNPLELRRTLIDGADDYNSFKCKVSGMYDRILD